MTEDGHILWTVSHPYMRVIFVKQHIEPPVQLILDLPLPTYALGKRLNLRRPVAQKIARLSRNVCPKLPF